MRAMMFFSSSCLMVFLASGCTTTESPPSLMPVIGPPSTPRRAAKPRPVRQPEQMRVIEAPTWGMKPTATPGTERKAAAREGDAEPAHQLPPFEVHERRFSDFGMSVITNVGVLRGGAIEWMRVGRVVSGSPAEKNGVRPGDDILAIDDALLSEVSREEMLKAFFGREKNETIKLVLYGGKALVPRIVVLKTGG